GTLETTLLSLRKLRARASVPILLRALAGERDPESRAAIERALVFLTGRRVASGVPAFVESFAMNRTGFDPDVSRWGGEQVETLALVLLSEAARTIGRR